MLEGVLADVDKDVVHHHAGGDEFEASAADEAGKGAKGREDGLAGGFLGKD